MTKTRLMPRNHWDWSMPVPFSQGWKIDGSVAKSGYLVTCLCDLPRGVEA